MATRPVPDEPLDPTTEYEAELKRLYRAILPSTSPNRNRHTGQFLFEAIEAYRDWIGTEYRDGAGKLTDHGKTKQDQLNMLKSYIEDCDLGQLDYHGCDELYGVFRRRPIWLHKKPEFDWRKPEDFANIRKQPQENDEDSEKESQPIPTWKVAELKTLWEYAHPFHNASPVCRPQNAHQL